MDYDSWLLKQADEYNQECKPTVIRMHHEPSDGEVMSIPEYSCEDCYEYDCEYWLNYHDVEELEQLKEILQ